MKRVLRRLMPGLLFGWFIGLNPAWSQSPGMDSISYFRNSLATHHKMGISAHRGASPAAPENTLATFRLALQMQVDYIEIDVRTTKDGKLVILHDGTLNRTTDGTGPVSKQTLADLKKLSAANGMRDAFKTERVPTLNEVCQLLADWNARHSVKTNLYVDCKDVAPEPLVATLTRYGLLTDAVFYGSDEKLLALKNTAPRARLMPGLKRADQMAAKIASLHPYAFDVSWSALTEALASQIHQQNIKVFSDLLDGFDTPAEYQKAAHFGVDVIQTDQVLLVYRTLAAKSTH
ncbi:glycerophosphodiester phosphodiesterase family protein [Spirosoma sp.]|uniref:glycerophosphodiester phosphodiesterase family protein n=1 Tax=Spirosoma sp. TaxID=1899569 RepID=UPI002629736A|nr:glycerophosphodiester phosphodiesterase family protein [Spirosoma sp.]MCX6218794.1 glycerophosphodiester phosphodiesterase family protein [Spirosoma sp.]